ncbi:MAG TPA: DUF6677 family protein [Blastocatellia bacterium]|nr:DUF6677 family protein [Blastocatellia bacterium]
MQPRDGLTESSQPTQVSAEAENLKPYALSRRIAAVVTGWLVPGAGHAILGCYRRAVLFFVLIAGSFFFGLALHGKLFWPTVTEPRSTFHYDLISVLWTFAQFGSGLCYLGSMAAGLGVKSMPEAVTYEYGNTFMFLAGLLNYLVVHDAFDIAAGRKP